MLFFVSSYTAGLLCRSEPDVEEKEPTIPDLHQDGMTRGFYQLDIAGQ